MKRVCMAATVLVLLLFLIDSANADTFACLACHSTMKGKVKTEKALVDVHVDSERYAQSVHGGIDCTTCHQQFTANPHQPKGDGDVSGDLAELAKNISRRAKVDAVALAAATATITDQQYFRENVEKIKTERTRLADELRSIGFSVPKSKSASL